MIRRPRLIRAFEKRVDAAVAAVSAGYDTNIADEDDFTSRLLDRLEVELNNWRHADILLRVRKLTSKGSRAEEAEFGADIVASVNIELKEYRAHKGILVQAKRLVTGGQFGTREWKNLEQQMARMHSHTEESYVWIYDSSGVRCIRSASLVGVSSRRPDDLYPTRCATFFGGFIQCKHGDHRINGFDRETLSKLKSRHAAKSAIALSFRDGGHHE